MTHITRIFGPPGTGKTTKLLEIVENALTLDIAPERIAYLSFSKKAAEEAIERAEKKFGFKKDRFPYFRTLHSLGFRNSFMSREEIMQFSDYKVIADELGLKITEYNDDEDSAYGMEVGDHAMNIHGLSRNRMITLEEEWKRAERQVAIPYAIVEQWVNTVNAYKKNHGLHDYPDMLERYNGALPVDVFIVDEAQDLSKLQWWVVGQAAKNAKKIYIAGDDDQCIFGWNGADLDSFLQFTVNEDIVLPKSYRVPSKILDFSNKISSNISRRKEKTWEPKAEVGEIFDHEHIDYLPLNDGEWMLLARNTKFLFRYERHLEKLGLLYRNLKKKNQLSINPEEGALIQGWEKLRNGGEVSTEIGNQILRTISPKSKKLKVDVVTMHSLPIAEALKSKPWYDVFSKGLSERKIEYIRSCLRNGQKLNEKPRITISTIHRVKGGEADNVVICPDLAYNSYQVRNTDDEHRVFYVAATRAKQNLWLLAPESRMFYEFY